MSALTVAACGGGSDSSAKPTKTVPQGTVALQGKTIAFAIPNGTAPVFVQQAKIFEEQARKLGATVKIYDNQGTAQALLSNANLMVSAKPDVIVEYSPVADATSRVGAMFQRAGIPCISLNVPVDGCPLFNFDQPYLAGIGAEAMAKEMKARGWDAGNTTVVLGQALALGPSVNIAGQSWYAKLSSIVPGMTPVKAQDITTKTATLNGTQGVQVDVGLTLNGAYTKVREVLQTIPRKNHVVIYTVSDDSTIGARRAAVNAGRKDVIVTGYGGDTDALKALRADDGWVTEQMGFFGYWGEFALAMVAAVEQGVTLPSLTSPPMVVLTKDNVDTYFKPGTDTLVRMPPLPPSSRYLIRTGVLQKYGNVEGAR